ncbi:hypothetical protein SAMN05421771_2317 [Granulicella pectinivorans]|uniref:Uncharacterized protein n=1 Tax=Granulicella pectinivorans TaxID=474950 RepID=A0A1I6MD10_9BACT|nr:hypothetical protein [Granulicella pectinivorans]SFS13478.1 hypothetical protein SAMN05421771_2317 [Granulicella pectinivorans]
MAKELSVRGGGALKKAAKKTALKKSAKKSALKKAPGKKAAKKVPGKKSAGKKAAKKVAMKLVGSDARAFHHLQRASAVISLLEGESGGDLRMLLEVGVARYRDEEDGAAGLLRAAEHLAMAGLYAARAMHRLDVREPAAGEVERLIDRVAVKVDELDESEEAVGFEARLPLMAGELLGRAEAAADQDLHLAWELAMAADGICEGLEG